LKFSERIQNWCLIGLLALASLIVYSNMFDNQFLLDDEFLLQKNTLLRSWGQFFKIFTLSSTGGAGGSDSFYRPMQTVCYLVFNQFFGFEPATFHGLSLLLHILVTSFIFLLGLRLGFLKMAVFCGALLWSVHPLHTESVTYMSAIADPLHTLFCLIGLWVMLPTISPRKIWFALPFFILGLLSKEPAIVFPAMACVLIYFKSEKPFSFREYVKTWPLWAVAFLYLVARKTVLNFDETFQFYKQSNIYTENFLFRLYTFFATIPNYLRLFFFPENLHLERSFPVHVSWTWEVILGFALLLGCLFFLIKERKRKSRVASFGVLWAMAAHVPQSGVLIPVNAFFLEHWMYFVSIGPVLAISEKLFGLLRSAFFRQVAVAGFVAVALILGFLTWQQNRRWADPITFYEYVLTVEEKPPARLFNNLAMAYAEQGKVELAQKNYLRAIEISDVYPQTRHNLGLLLIKQGKIDEAIEQFKRAVKMNPDFYHSYAKLAQIYQVRNDKEKAAEYQKRFEEARSKFGN